MNIAENGLNATKNILVNINQSSVWELKDVILKYDIAVINLFILFFIYLLILILSRR